MWTESPDGRILIQEIYKKIYLTERRISMRMQSHFTICLLFISLLSACQPTTSISNEAIAGTYNVTLTQEQLYANGATFRNANEFNGTWRLEFGEDGVVRLFQENNIELGSRTEGPYTLSADEIVFGADTGAISCAKYGVTEQGTYQWKLEGNQLYLSVIEDNCEHRANIYSAQPWTKQP